MWGILLPACPASTEASPLFAGLLIVRVLFQLSQNAALLQLHVETLESAVDRFVGLDGYVDQIASMPPARTIIMAQVARRLKTKFACLLQTRA